MKIVNSKVLQNVDATTLKQWLELGLVTLVDVREVSEHTNEHLANSVLVPFSQFDPNQIPVEKDKKLVLYCRSGNRSAQAAQKLFVAGFEEVTHLGGGIEEWKQKGYPIITNKDYKF